jgi:hypothetical protein
VRSHRAAAERRTRMPCPVYLRIGKAPGAYRRVGKRLEESRHTRIVLGSKVTRMPRHPAKEIKMGTLQSILKDLDLKM